MPRPYYDPDAQNRNHCMQGNMYLDNVTQVQAPMPYLHTNTTSNTFTSLDTRMVYYDETDLLEAADQRLKYRIRVLRLVSRVVSLILSITTLVPLAMTVAKYLSTRDVYFNVAGTERTAWSQDTIAWYTYMYFGVSLTSFTFDILVVVAYWHGIKKANRMAAVASWWTTIVLVGHVLIWIVGVAIYRYGKQPVGGRFRDLWGWTCSPVAQAIQKDIPNVDFGQYCIGQSASFYAGLVNVGTGILTVTIMILVGLRSRSKKRSQEMSTASEVKMDQRSCTI